MKLTAPKTGAIIHHQEDSLRISNPSFSTLASLLLKCEGVKLPRRIPVFLDLNRMAFILVNVEDDIRRVAQRKVHDLSIRRRWQTFLIEVSKNHDRIFSHGLNVTDFLDRLRFRFSTGTYAMDTHEKCNKIHGHDPWDYLWDLLV